MLPNAHLAIVPAEKVRDYLLSRTHPTGRFKQAVFTALGYEQLHWETLHRDLLTLARSGLASEVETTSYGRKYRVGGTLTGPNGRSGRFVSIWIIGPEGAPRLVTAYPA